MGNVFVDFVEPDPRRIKPTIEEYGYSRSEYVNTKFYATCFCKNNQWIPKYLISYDVDIYISIEESKKYKVSLKGIYGHEQRHVLSRNKVIKDYFIDKVLASFDYVQGFLTKDECIKHANMVVVFTRMEFSNSLRYGDNHIDGQSEAPFVNDLSPRNGIGYPPLDGTLRW